MNLARAAVSCKVFPRPSAGRTQASQTRSRCQALRARTVLCKSAISNEQTPKLSVDDSLTNTNRRGALTAAVTAGTALCGALAGPTIPQALAESTETTDVVTGPESTILHMVIRAPDVKAAAEFYKAAGMEVIRERPGNIFVGYGPEVPGERMVIELAQAKPDAKIGTALEYLLISTEEPEKLRAATLAAGGVPAKAGASGRAEAVQGPDGVKLVFTSEVNGVADPLLRLVLNVDSLEPTRLFMQGLGMKVFETRFDAKSLRNGIIMGYGRGPRTSASIEIVGPPRKGAVPVEIGDVYDRLAISSTDIDASVARVRKAIDLAEGAKVPAGRVVKDPFVIERLGTKIAEVVDPTGLVYALVDTDDFLRELA
eukprot:CAMPEP_0118922044 /NCGR_PEP_ID=MMETSP1169-20130426/1111_1 /TAXON_ID=36882 /ORGANISM="Pyramimonas obovata, Strain CCMP722" /LENGTH=369 /DNA_ID=CAMNT_0006862857 /DNA_START=77 /DNA_END=1186 /DNA_ORIENTATION=-